MMYQTYRSVRLRYWCCTQFNEVSGTGIDVVHRTYLSVRYPYESMYRYRRYRYCCRTELTEVSSTGIDVVPKLPKYPVPVLISYRTYRGVRHRYWRCTELTEVSGTGIDVVYQTYGSVRYRYESLYRYRRYRYPLSLIHI